MGTLSNTLSYLAAFAKFVLIAGAAFAGARAWRRIIVPEWRDGLGALADAAGAISIVVLASELLGSIGLFSFVPLVVVLLIQAVASMLYVSSQPRIARASEPDVRTSESWLLRLVVPAACCALVMSQWATWVARTVSYGVGNVGGPGNGDSLWYHMPTAASFVQTGWTSHVIFTNGEALVSYYPANTSVLHAVGFLAFGSDFLSPFINLALVPVCLLAGWCIGVRRGAGPGSLAGVAVALTMPVVVVSEAGTAKDDVLGLAGLLAAVAFLVSGEPAGLGAGAGELRLRRAPAALYSGLAAGLALGAKLTLVAPVVALGALAVVLAPRGTRRFTAVPWLLGATATGGYWYIRNALLVRNPLPGLRIGSGSLHLPRPVTPSMDDFGSNLLHSLSHSGIWRLALFPGLRQGFGAAWPLPLIIVAVALCVGVWTMRGRDAVIPLTGVLSAGAFLITPGTVWAPQLVGIGGAQFVTANLFAFNLRYLLPVVAIGLAILPLVLGRWRRGPALATVALGLSLLALQAVVQGRESWAGHEVPTAVLTPIFCGAVCVALVSGLSLAELRARLRIHVKWRWGLVALSALIAVAALGRTLEVHYDSYRYGGLDLAQWANHHPGTRIGYSGFVFSYPLYGAHLTNRVQMIGARGPDGGWHPATSCMQWRRAVRAAGVEYVVVPVGPPATGLGIDLSRWRVGLPGGEPPDEPPESRWTRHDPYTPLVFYSTEGAGVYEVTGPATSIGCNSSGRN